MDEGELTLALKQLRQLEQKIEQQLTLGDIGMTKKEPDVKITKQTIVPISINMLIWIVTTSVIITLGWGTFKAYGQRIDKVENVTIPAMQEQDKVNSEAITGIQKDMEYIKKAQDNFSLEQKSFRSEVLTSQQVLRTEILSEQQDTRKVLRSMLKEMKNG